MTPKVATIGFFDGVHHGHRFLIRRVMDEARKRGMESLLITFQVHPRAVIQPTSCPQLLTTFDEKRSLLQATGADHVEYLAFTPEMAAFSARQFMQQYLYERMGVRVLFIGYDHHFGHSLNEGFEDYQRYGCEMGIDVLQAPQFKADGLHCSSSAIRHLVGEGHVLQAGGLLGRPYSLQGQVVTGQQIGRTLGYPTANIAVSDPCKLIPLAGVYAVQVEVVGASEVYPAMLNIGTRPTIDNSQRQSIEAHLFGYSGNLYGQLLRVHFVDFLRSEQKFDSVEALVCQLEADARSVQTILSTHNLIPT